MLPQTVIFQMNSLLIATSNAYVPMRFEMQQFILFYLATLPSTLIWAVPQQIAH